MSIDFSSLSSRIDGGAQWRSGGFAGGEAARGRCRNGAGANGDGLSGGAEGRFVSIGGVGGFAVERAPLGRVADIANRDAMIGIAAVGGHPAWQLTVEDEDMVGGNAEQLIGFGQQVRR